MSRRKISGEKVALISVMIVLVGLASIALSSEAMGKRTKAWKIRSGGNVKPGIGVGVYWNRVCDNPVSSIDWGGVKPGSSRDILVFIRNERKGNSDINIYLDTTNWEPEAASSYITISWDYDGQSINPNEVVEITLTLSVSPSVEGVTSFSHDIVITASG